VVAEVWAKVQRDRVHIVPSYQAVDNANKTIVAKDDREQKEACATSGERIHTVAPDPPGAGKADGRPRDCAPRVVRGPDGAESELDCKNDRHKNEEKLVLKTPRTSSNLPSDQDCALGGYMWLEMVSPGDLLCCRQFAPLSTEDMALPHRAVDAYYCYRCDAHADHSDFLRELLREATGNGILASAGITEMCEAYLAYTW
jgi:hypothetical protein